MDFSRVELSDDDQAFLDEARDFLRTHVTDEVLRRDRETGDNFDEGVHLALGEAGYLEKEWNSKAASIVSGPESGRSRSDAPTYRGSRPGPRP
jgi:alkylation response protein AidB-like acyl-CoA dehydrogenase